jgi:hypothetical protein
MAARFLLEQRERKLPDFIRFEVTERGVTVYLASGALLRRWVKAYGGKAADIRSYDIKKYDPPYTHSTYRIDAWRSGWSLTLNADEDVVATSGAGLDADTVAGLEEIASPASPVEDHGVVPEPIREERVAEILAELNRLCGVQAEADRTAKAGGYVGVLDWWDWIHDAVPEFDPEATAASADHGTLHLSDGTVFVWERQSKAWTVSA